MLSFVLALMIAQPCSDGPKAAASSRALKIATEVDALRAQVAGPHWNSKNLTEALKENRGRADLVYQMDPLQWRKLAQGMARLHKLLTEAASSGSLEAAEIRHLFQTIHLKICLSTSFDVLVYFLFHPSIPSDVQVTSLRQVLNVGGLDASIEDLLFKLQLGAEAARLDKGEVDLIRNQNLSFVVPEFSEDRLPYVVDVLGRFFANPNDKSAIKWTVERDSRKSKFLDLMEDWADELEAQQKVAQGASPPKAQTPKPKVQLPKGSLLEGLDLPEDLIGK